MCNQQGRTGGIATRFYVDSESGGVRVERRGIRPYACSGCGRRTGRVRSRRDRTWDDLPWALTTSRSCIGSDAWSRSCGIRTERIEFADPKARVTRRLRQQIGVDCQSMPTSHAAVRHGVSWGKACRAEKAFLADWDATRVKRRPRMSASMRFSAARGNNSGPSFRMSCMAR
jgi:Helix-turn-helix domain of transposase family ISL3